MIAELAGRDGLASLAPAMRLELYVDKLTVALLEQKRSPLVLFGHSMGALLAFEIARELRRRNGPRPRAICISAHRAPQLPDSRRPIHDLPEVEFVAELRALGGIPEEVLKNRQLIEFFMPLLRADLSCCENYRYADEPPLDCSILAFGGIDDREVGMDQGNRVKESCGEEACEEVVVPGGGFAPKAE
jgi:medium-chain acyl-[acyl-carrier-protein] hydrolase